MLTIDREPHALGVYDSMACALWVRDASGRLLHINRHAFEMFGRVPGRDPLPAARARGWTMCDQDGRLLTEEQYPSNLAIRTSQPQRHQVVGVRLDTGEFRWLMLDAIPVADEHGVVQRSVTTAIDVTSLKQSEISVKVSEERYRRIVETTREGVCLLDADSRITYVNHRVCQMLGYKPDEILGLSSFDLIENSVASAHRGSPLLAALRSGEQRDLALRHRDGTLVWAIVSGAPIVGDNGFSSAVLLLLTDVTARKLSEDALRLSEARFRALVENGSDVISILDRHGTMLYLSPSVKRLVGRERSEHDSNKLFDYLHPDDLAGACEAFQALSEKPGATQALQARFRHADGTWHFAEGLAENCLDDPVIGGIVLNMRDVTERCLAEDRARAARALLEQLTADAVLVVDEQARTVSWNSGAERLFGWSREEVLGHPLPIVPPEAWEQGMRDMQRMLASGETVTMETIRVSRDGERIPVLGSWSRVLIDGGGLGAMSILKDLRAHEEAHRKLAEQAESLALLRERERIAMDLHDGVIQSLYGVTLTLGALRRQVSQQSLAVGDEASSALNEAIRGLTKSIEHIREYIFDLRAGIPEECDLQAGLRVLARQFEGSTGIAPHLNLGAESDMLSAEVVAHLLHIAREALSNITRHAHAQTVSIELSQTGPRLQLAIADNGRGFDPGRKGRRAGDGLRNMRERARQLHGKLSLESVPGQGTTVSVVVTA